MATVHYHEAHLPPTTLDRSQLSTLCPTGRYGRIGGPLLDIDSRQGNLMSNCIARAYDKSIFHQSLSGKTRGKC